MVLEQSDKGRIRQYVFDMFDRIPEKYPGIFLGSLDYEIERELNLKLDIRDFKEYRNTWKKAIIEKKGKKYYDYLVASNGKGSKNIAKAEELRSQLI